MSWNGVPKRTAGASFTAADYARARAEEVARATLGDQTWELVQRQGFVDLPSKHFRGLTYRLRVGRRIELIWTSPAAANLSPWPYRYLCINPVYPLPAAEFMAQLYLFVRDDEAMVVRLAAPQPYDQALGRTF